jgi:hypothetical protein
MYRVVEANALTPATGVLQPRDRANRQGSDVQIAENASRLDPFRLGAFPTAEHGAPVVMNDGTVLAGNGRLAAINRAAELHPERYDAYKQSLTDLGHGISGFQRPILVRQATGDVSPEDARKFAEASNVPAGQVMSPVEQAKVDARNLTDQTLAKYDPTKQLTSPVNRDFMRDWMQSVPAVERNRLLDAQGNLSSEGLRRVQGAVLAKAYEHDGLLTRALESPVDDVKSITGSLMDTAAPYVKLKSEINQGRLPGAFDITHNIGEALDLINQARTKGIAPGDILKQGDMFSGAKLDPVTEQVVRTFYNDQMTRLRSRPKMTEALREYVTQAMSYRPGKDLFGAETKPDPAELLRTSRGGGQGDLIAAESRAPVVETAPETKPTAKPAPATPVAADDEEDHPDTELENVDQLSPEELMGDDEEADTEANTSVARVPEEQAALDRLNEQITGLENTIARARRANSSANKISTLEGQLGKLVKRRSAMAAGAELERRIRPGQFRPKPTRAPYNPRRPKPPGAPPDAMDYSFRASGNSVWRQAFTDAGENPDLATSRPLTWQIGVLARQTQKQFGLKGVTYDPKMDKLELRNVLLDTYRAATDGMASLGYPADALGLFKTVGLHFHPFHPKYAGMYDVNPRIINLAGTANSLGHEWTHALDHWLYDQYYAARGTNPIVPLASQEATFAGGDPTDTMAQRFGHVINTLFYDDAEHALQVAHLQSIIAKGGTRAAAAQKMLDEMTTGKDVGLKGSRFRDLSNAFQQQVNPQDDYYGRIYELIARAHEAYISRRMEDAGVDPRGFVMAQSGYLSDTVRGLNMIYPKEPERAAIHAAFDHLHNGLHNLLTTGSPAGVFSDKDQQIDLNNFELNKRLPPGAIQALKRAWAETVSDVKEWQVSFALMRNFDPSRPVSNYDWKQRLHRLLARIYRGPMGQFHIMHAMIPQGARDPLRQIMDMLGTLPGSNHPHGATYEDRWAGLLHQWGNKYSHIMRDNNLMPRDIVRLEQQGIPVNDMIHHAMTTVLHAPSTYKGQAIPGHLQRAAGQLRALMDDVFHSLRQAGVDIQYSQNGHFPRVYDLPRIWNDKHGFTQDAKTLFKWMFDDEVGTPGDNPDKLLARWRQLSMVQRALAPQSVQDAMVELAKILRKLKTVQLRLMNAGTGQITLTPKQHAKALAQEAQLTQDAEDLAGQWHDMAGNHIAKLGADEWAHRVNVGYQTDFDTLGPSGAFLNHRVLPPAADDIMKKWIVTDVNGALMRYFQAAARKQAFHEVLGPNQDKFEALVDQMDKGGAQGEDIRLVRDLTDLITGRGNYRNARGPMKAIAWVKAYAVVRLLGASFTAMIGEPAMTTGATRDLRSAVKAYAAQFGAVLHTATAQERAEIADMIGVTTSALYDDILLNRSGTDYADSPRLGAHVAALYRGLGMTGYNNWNRRAAVASMNWFLTKSANDWLAWKGWQGPKRGRDWRRADERGQVANQWLNEIGVPTDNATRDGFAQWMVAHDGVPGPSGERPLRPPTGPGGSRLGKVAGRLPRSTTLQTSVWRPIYELAMNRLVDRSIMNPKPSGIPDAGIGPVAKAILQFQTFSFAVQDNVLDPMFAAWGQHKRRAIGRAQAEGLSPLRTKLAGMAALGMEATNTATSGAMVVAAQVPGSILRLMIYHPDVFQRELKNGTLGEYIFDYALNQSGLNGALTLPLQALSQIRFNSSPEGMFVGPGLTTLSHDIADIWLAATGGGDANTNTRIYKGVRATYNMMMTPTLAYGLAKVAGGFGPLPTFAAGLGYSLATSRPVQDFVTSTLVGPEGAARPTPSEGGLQSLEGMEGLEGLPSLGSGPPDLIAGGDHGFTSSIPWGMLDDVMFPVARQVLPYIAKLPVSVQATAVAGLAVWGGRWFWNYTEDWRNAPPPEPKKGPGYP